MSTAFATHADVAAVWRSLSEYEKKIVQRRLEQASRIIRHEVAGVDERITAGTLDADLVKDVAVDMVVRYMSNPEGIRSETIEDYSFTRDQATSDGAIYMTAREISMLTPVAQARTGKAFTVPQDSPARVLDTETAGFVGFLGGGRRW